MPPFNQPLEGFCYAVSPLTEKQPQQILCYYTNRTNQLQTVRITDIPNHSFERTVLPDQSILFQAQPDSQLEILKPTVSASIPDSIPCSSLRASKEVLSNLLIRVL